MSDDTVPIIIGNAGLVGRQQIARTPLIVYEDEDDEDGRPVQKPNAVGAMPGNCRRVLYSPLPLDRGGGCDSGCGGFQRDGRCLLDVVKAAVAAGVDDWQFQIDPVSLFWEYCGPPFEQKKEET